MPYRETTILDWAAQLEGLRIDRAFARETGGVTLLTLEFEDGRLFDLMGGTNACPTCSQKFLVPGFYRHSDQVERDAPVRGRLIEFQPDKKGLNVSFEMDAPLRMVEEEGDGIADDAFDDELHLSRHQGAVEETTDLPRTMTRREYEHHLQTAFQSPDEMLAWLRTEGKRVKIVEDA